MAASQSLQDNSSTSFLTGLRQCVEKMERDSLFPANYRRGKHLEKAATEVEKKGYAIHAHGRRGGRIGKQQHRRSGKGETLVIHVSEKNFKCTVLQHTSPAASPTNTALSMPSQPASASLPSNSAITTQPTSPPPPPSPVDAHLEENSRCWYSLIPDSAPGLFSLDS